MSEVEQTVPTMDHSAAEHSNGPTEQELLDAVMRQSPIMEEVGFSEPLPEEEIPEVDPEESEEEVDPEDSEDAVSEEEYEEEVEGAEDEDGTEVPTQDADVFTADDLDLDAKVRVKIDGEELDVSFSDLLKGYQTDASLSKKGRELGEAKKQLEEQYATQAKEINELGQASAAILLGEEQNLSKQYHSLEAQIEKARQEEDTFELDKLKDKREQVQKKYWNARKQREGIQTQLTAQQAKREQEQWEANMQYFQENIESYVPGFDDKVASDIREFAIGEGLPAAIVDSIMDPQVVKVLNDYRTLKQGVTKGEAKRKAVPTKKVVPTKKAKSPTKKAADKDKMIKARAFREDASKDDQDAFLKQYAAKSLNL